MGGRPERPRVRAAPLIRASEAPRAARNDSSVQGKQERPALPVAEGFSGASAVPLYPHRRVFTCLPGDDRLAELVGYSHQVRLRVAGSI